MRPRFFVAALLAAAACANGDAGDQADEPAGDEAGAPHVGGAPDASDVAVSPDVGTQDTTPACDKTICAGACVDMQSDLKNCGACGHACAAGQTCVAAVCVVPCDAGLTACGSACVNTTADLANCGKCGNACPGAAQATCAAGKCTATLRVRAYIDGTSDIVFAGSTVHWHHISGAAPGLWNSANQPTYLSAAPWTPVWPGGGDNRDCNCDSQMSPQLLPLGAHDQTVALQVVYARGPIAITQQPSSANAFALRVELTDPANGADWYELVLTYETQ
jgi:hypothetical protein